MLEEAEEEDNENTYVAIDEFSDGETFLITSVEFGENADQILISRGCAIEIVEILTQMLGIKHE